MRISIIYLLLITYFLSVISCKTTFIPASTDYQNISVSNTGNEVDSQIIKIYTSYKNILDKDMSRVISVSDVEMIKKRPESSLTNFLCDLLIEESMPDIKNYNKQKLPVISYFNYGGIRSYLPKGEITVGKIFELMPFENEMVYIKLTGRQVREFLDNISIKGGGSVGGARYTVVDGNAGDIFINGERLSDDKKYWLVTNDYIAEGGDGMDVLTHSEQIIKTGKKIRDVIIGYMEKMHDEGKKLRAEKDGRVKNG